MLIPECPKGDISPGSKTSCPNEAGEGSFQRRSLVVDQDRLFISGPAVVEILHDNRPVFSSFDFSLMGSGGCFDRRVVIDSLADSPMAQV